MERLTTAGTTSSTPHVVHAVKESSSVSDWDKVPKFRKLEVEEDVDAYLDMRLIWIAIACLEHSGVNTWLPF